MEVPRGAGSSWEDNNHETRIFLGRALRRFGVGWFCIRGTLGSAGKRNVEHNHVAGRRRNDESAIAGKRICSDYRYDGVERKYLHAASYVRVRGAELADLGVRRNQRIYIALLNIQILDRPECSSMPRV